MKLRLSRLILATLLLPAVLIHADTITLVTGEQITGTIKSETDTDVTIDVPVSSSITDERVIRKADISKEDKAQPDELAYKELIAVQPSQQLSYSSDTYSQILASLRAFEAKYPSSSYLADVKRLDAVFQKEKDLVDAGQIKFMGRWLTKDEADRRAIQIEALKVYGTMQQQATAGDLLGAMVTFDSIEKQYPTTRSYPPAVTLAQQVLARFQQDLAARLQQIKADQVQLKQTIFATAEPEKSNIIAAAKAEQDRSNAVIAAALKARQKWVPLIPRSQLSIETLQKAVTSEATRIASVPVAAMMASIEKVDAARNAMTIHDYSTAQTLLKDATQLWGQDEAARYWGERLKETMATPTPARATPKPSVKPTPRPTPTPPPNPTPQQADTVTPASSGATADKPFYMTVPGVISIAAGVLIVGGIVAFIVKKKADDQIDG